MLIECNIPLYNFIKISNATFLALKEKLIKSKQNYHVYFQGYIVWINLTNELVLMINELMRDNYD